MVAAAVVVAGGLAAQAGAEEWPVEVDVPAVANHEPDWDEFSPHEQLAMLSLHEDADRILWWFGQSWLFQLHDPEADLLLALARLCDQLAVVERMWARHAFDTQVRACIDNGHEDCLQTVEPQFHISENYEINARWLHASIIANHPTHPAAAVSRERLGILFPWDGGLL